MRWASSSAATVRPTRPDPARITRGASPSMSGGITPNHAIGGQSVSIVHNWNISPGIQGTVRAELMQAIKGR